MPANRSKFLAFRRVKVAMKVVKFIYHLVQIASFVEEYLE